MCQREYLFCIFPFPIELLPTQLMYSVEAADAPREKKLLKYVSYKINIGSVIERIIESLFVIKRLKVSEILANRHIGSEISEI